MTTAPPPAAPPISPIRVKYPRRNRKSPPKEIHISPGATGVKRSSNASPSLTVPSLKTEATPVRASGVVEALRRVALVPGSAWLNGKLGSGAVDASAQGDAISTGVPPPPPPPPCQAPPRPTELLSLLLVGPDDAGKRALMDQFVSDANCNHNNSSNKNDSSSTQQQAALAPEGWSVEYRKKDWAYHRSGSTGSTTTPTKAAAATTPSATSTPAVQCVRLQLWNATANTSNGTTNTSSNNDTSTNPSNDTTLPPDDSLAWPAALETHCKHMVLVVSMANSASLAELQKTVRTWKRYLDHATARTKKNHTMQLIMTVPASSNRDAAYCLRVGAAMQRLATELSILAPSWAVVDTPTPPTTQKSASTSLDEIHATWMGITEQVLSWKQQRQGYFATASAATATAIKHIMATATASTPANRKTGGSFDNSSPGTIVLDATDVIPISPDNDEHLIR